jgi:hypothetical protein
MRVVSGVVLHWWPKNTFIHPQLLPRYTDLAPSDFFLFPRLKSIMKAARFADVAAIQERVTGSEIDS